jgi:hypothetical protein
MGAAAKSPADSQLERYCIEAGWLTVASHLWPQVTTISSYSAGCTTTAQQTDESHFKRTQETQVYPERVNGTYLSEYVQEC